MSSVLNAKPLEAPNEGALERELREIERAATELRWLLRRALQNPIPTIPGEHHEISTRDFPLQSSPSNSNSN